MKTQLRLIALTALMLVVLDVMVAGLLLVADDSGRKGKALVRYFDYGRSVPGKLDDWIAHPERPDNLFDVAWISEGVADSAQEFATAPVSQEPVIRAYGMSFVAGILRAAQKIDPELETDMHGGPAAPPNLAYELFLQDRANRRAGDVVVLGVLSSSMPAMAAMSNRTWAFEQPAPFTYPIFLPDGEDGLRKITPLVQSAAQERALRQDPEAAAAWEAQLSANDRLYTKAAFGWPWMDASPFFRLVRRSLAVKAINAQEADLITARDDYPYETVLQRIIVDFARVAREDGQYPIVFLIQSRDPGDFDVKAMSLPVLTAQDIAFLATVDHVDPRNPAAFIGDGHYTKPVNLIFGQAFLDGLRRPGLRN